MQLSRIEKHNPTFSDPYCRCVIRQAKCNLYKTSIRLAQRRDTPGWRLCHRSAAFTCLGARASPSSVTSHKLLGVFYRGKSEPVSLCQGLLRQEERIGACSSPEENPLNIKFNPWFIFKQQRQ
ncbi:hypothetical protein RRG08_016954 [Elysia crispata]|uniref:Uncharacterized protein n=1 Tax=Elysia crispata TaxID=231223 RepID=A0AAE1DT81_9GAST|nr:hypothetical protein RRG08_016954 [Elysia crispata]